MPFGSEQWMYSSGGFYPYEIDQSLRFNDDDSAYLSRTPASTGDRKTWTWSGWVKRSELAPATNTLFGSGTSGTDWCFLYFQNDDKLVFYSYGSAGIFPIRSTPLYRDVSAWYHIVLAVDTTQATSSNRVKIWVNNQQITAFSEAIYPDQNDDLVINSTSAHAVGAFLVGSPINYFNGYMAEVNFVDGQALDATSFSEFKSGVWVPKRYSGTYGTNGFYLDFGNSGSLGADSSGNGNNWTPNNLAVTDQVLDSPTNNFCTWNPLILASLSLSEGNLRSIPVGFAFTALTQGTQSVSSGKWYMEFDTSQGGTNGNCMVGVVGSSTFLNGAWYSASNGWAIDNNVDGNLYKRHNGTATSLGARASSAVLLMVAVDLDAGKIWFGQNGTWLEGNPSAGTGASYEDVFLEVQAATFQYSNAGSGDVIIANFGQDSSFAGNKTAQGNTDANGIGDFYYAPPAGYLALCTANLPNPVIDPAQDDVPADYFNTVLYTATGNDNLAITGVGFQPDFTWIKSRSAAYSHNFYDAVRGVSKRLQTNLLNAESSPISGVKSFDADGFTLGNDTNDTNFTSGVTYASWNWLAGNGTSSNTDGTIASTVSANQKAGFSIVTYTGDGASTTTIGHGLSKTPEMYIVKNRTDGSTSWMVYSNQIPVANYLILDGNNPSGVAGLWGSGPTSSVITVTTNSQTNANTKNFVAYCFHGVEGYSKFGSYTGNGSADGPFVYTGFRPAFVMVKRTDTTENWHIQDSSRSSYNWQSATVYANLSNAEYNGTAFEQDYLSNGFKFRTTNAGFNASGGTYIFMAFAEMPFKYSLGR